MRRVWVGMALCVGSLASGCVTVPGSAAPASGVTSGPSTVAGLTGIVLPPRPREVPIDGIEPCSLLTAGQRAELGLNRPPLSKSSPSALYNGGQVPRCSYAEFTPRAIGATVFLVTSAGIDLWASGGLDAVIRPTSVAGFPAIVAVPRVPDFCTVIIDVAPGQLVDVQFRDGGRTPPIPQEQLCRDGERVAGAVMTTLLAR